MRNNKVRHAHIKVRFIRPGKGLVRCDNCETTEILDQEDMDKTLETIDVFEELHAKCKDQRRK